MRILRCVSQRFMRTYYTYMNKTGLPINISIAKLTKLIHKLIAPLN